MSKTNRKKGIVHVLAAWLFFTFVIALSKEASTRTSVPTVLFFQNFVSLLVTFPWIIKRGRKSLYLSKFGVIVIRTLAGYLSYAFVFLAVQRVPLVDAILLRNTAPIFIPLIIFFWKKVKISKTIWLGIILGFIGIFLILKPTQAIFNTGALFGLGSGLCIAVSLIAQRRLMKSEPIFTILFYYFLISTIISIPFAFDAKVTIDRPTFFLLIGIGLLFVCGQYLNLRAFKYAKPSFLSIFNYSSVVYGAAIAWIFWSQLPDWQTVLGIVVVCTGGILTAWHGTRGITARDRDQSPH